MIKRTRPGVVSVLPICKRLKEATLTDSSSVAKPRRMDQTIVDALTLAIVYPGQRPPNPTELWIPPLFKDAKLHVLGLEPIYRTVLRSDVFGVPLLGEIVGYRLLSVQGRGK
jgi:hypothetical protein